MAFWPCKLLIEKFYNTFILQKREKRERIYPEKHLASWYIASDGPGSSPGERTQKSDRYAGRTQVGRR